MVLKKITNQFSHYFTKTVIMPIGQVLGSQFLLQILGFGIGIILVREMPKTDYAIYTVLMSVQAILAILSTSGIMIGFIKVGGEIWNDRIKLASLIKTATQLRSRITFFAFIVTAIYGFFLLVEQKIEWYQIGIFLTCVLLIVIPEIYKSFIMEVFLLRKEIENVQWVQLITQASRLFLLILVFIFLRNHLTINIVLIITIISVWLGYWFLINRGRHFLDRTAPIRGDYKKILLHYIKRVWHNELFFAFRGQISIFLIGVFGATSSLADLGALGRFAVVFTVLTALVTNISAPHFARTHVKTILKKQYTRLMLFLGTFSLAIVLFTYFFPNIFLWILGSKYAGLERELNLVMILGAINLFIGGISYLNQTKGWIKFRTYWEIPLNIVVLILGVLIFDISNLIGVLYLSIFVATANLILSFINSFWGFSHFNEEKKSV